jgi:hypothetical protein
MQMLFLRFIKFTKISSRKLLESLCHILKILSLWSYKYKA